MPRNVVAVGPDAVRKTIDALAALELGRFPLAVLSSGDQWGGDRMLVSVHGGSVQFVIGNTLYTQDRVDFIRTEFPPGVAAPRRGSWLQGLSTHEMPYYFGLAAELSPAWAGIASAAAYLDRFSHFYRSHRTDIQLAGRKLRYVAEVLLALEHSPPLFALVMDSMGELAQANLPKGLSAADMGSFVGRLLLGIQHRRAILRQLPECVRAITEPGKPPAEALAQTWLCSPYYRRMLRNLKEYAESAAPLIEQLGHAL